MTTTGAAGLRVRGLRRGGPAPLHGDFDARPGETTALLSADGSGAALLLAALGLEPAAAGTSDIAGHRLVDDGRALGGDGRPVAVLGPAPVVSPRRTVGEQLAAASGRAGACCADPIALAGSYGLEAVAETPAGELPLAMQHRLALGLAVAGGPRLVAAIAPWDGLAAREAGLLEGIARVAADECGFAFVHATAVPARGARMNPCSSSARCSFSAATRLSP
ncbi:MAG: hypothetical protein GXX90_10165 [Microbacteriaceae bacterium]|nr:hypothetical protein [Microbacteriaceae bacterium]